MEVLLTIIMVHTIKAKFFATLFIAAGSMMIFGMMFLWKTK